MYIMAIGWGYVALMMALAEATNPNGSILGAILTFVCSGLMPGGLLLYIRGRPARRRRREQQAAASVQPDAGGHASGAAEPGSVAPVRKEP